MKALIYIIIIWVGIFCSPELLGQHSFDHHLGRFDSEDKPDSAFLLIDQYEKIYQANEQWDSLLYLLHQKCNLSFRYKTIALVKRQLEEAERIANLHVTEDNIIYLNYLNFKSDFYTDLGDFRQAEDILDRIIQIATNFENDSTGKADNAKAEKAFLLLHLGRVKESEALASSVYQNILDRGDTSQMISVLQSLTMSNHFLNRYDKALAYNEENLKIVQIRFGQSHPNVGLMYSQMAGIYADKGQVNKALEYYNKSKDIHLKNYKKSGASRFLSNTIGNLGDFYANIGEHRLAIDHMTYSLDLETKEYGEDSWKRMWHYSVLSTANRLYGDYDQADYYIARAFDLIAKNDASTPYDYHLFLSRKAEMLYTRNKYDEALQLALEVYLFYEKNEAFGSTNDRLHILNLISDIHRESGALEEAERWSKKNIKFHNENTAPLSSMRINILTSYLTLLTEKMDSTKAYEIKDEILKLRNNGNGEYTLSNCIPEDELLYFSASWVEFLVKMSIHDERYRKEYFTFLEDFENYYSVHLSTIKTNSNLASNELYLKQIFAPAIYFLSDSEPETALLNAEKCKNFSTRQILQSQLIDDQNLPTLNYSLDDSPELNDDTVSVDIFINLAASLDSISIYKDSLFKADRTKYEKYFGVRQLTIADIRKLIREDELMVDFFMHDSLVYAFYLDKDKVICHKYKFNIIDSLVAQVLNFNHQESGSHLRTILLPDSMIEKSKKIKILPDGILNSLSFEQLMYEKRPLIYSKLISYGLSASVLLYQEKLTNKKVNKNQFLGLTPGFTKDLKSKMQSMYMVSDSGFYYLLQQPFLLSLSESLSRDFSGKTYQEADATEGVFKAQAQDFRILHIGTHGILNDQSPLFSKLIFAKDSIEDGYLHAYELYGKNLNAELAVLSACSSGKEKTYASEGIVSLSHAFTHAGCPSVLMTKWDVDEKSTSTILASFYSNLKKGKSKSEALRDAKLSFLKKSPAELHDPYYWAGLVLIGDDSAMFSKPWYTTGLGITGIVLLLFLMIFLIWKKYFRN